MKQLSKIAIGMVLFTFLFTPYSNAQEKKDTSPKATLLSVTKVHWDFSKEDGSKEEWLKIEKEYFDKVTMKNEFILSTNFLTHYFTADNTEALAVTAYENWEAIDKATKRTEELEKKAWPNEANRKAFMNKRNSYYQSKHSDELLRVLPGAKPLADRGSEAMIYYVRVTQMAFPEDGKNEEITDFHQQYLDNVVYKNKYVQGYYVYRHGWGADSREFTEVFVVNSLADIEAGFDENGRLSDEAWSEEEQKEMGKIFSKYRTGVHGDFLYQSVPELIK